MANEIFKEIKTKIALKQQTYAEWTANTDTGANYIPLYGEVCFCEIPAAPTTGNAEATNAPTVLFKIGTAKRNEDGSYVAGTNKKFSELRWVSALAADVYGWAKKEHLDVNDLPTLPIEVIDNETGKFVTDFEYANNKLTIHRADAVNSLAANDDDVVVLSVDKSTGDVIITGEHAKKGPADGYTGGQVTNEIDAFGESITIKVPKLSVDAYGHTNSAEDVEYTITLPTPEAATNTVTLLTEGNGIEVEDTATDGNHNYVVSHADTSSVANVVAADRTYVKSLTFDDYGHVTAVDVGTETVVDTDTQYHVEYDSAAKKIKLVAGADASKMEIPTDDFIKDGMISSVTISEDGENLVITWNSDAGKDVTNIPLTELVDIMTGVDGTTIKVEVSADDKISAEVKTESIKDGHIAKDAAIAETKLAQGVQDALALARTALQSHQDISGKADKVTGATAGNFAGLDENGNLTDSGKKADDFQAANDTLKHIADNYTFNDIGKFNQSIGVGNYMFGTAVTMGNGCLSIENDGRKGGTDYTLDEIRRSIGEGDNAGSYTYSYPNHSGTIATEGWVEGKNYLTEITTTANNGLKVTNKNNIDIDTDVVFVLDCNW